MPPKRTLCFCKKHATALKNSVLPNFAKVQIKVSFMFNFFKASQGRLDEIKRQQARKQREIEREVCALISRGNVSLQRGEYITRDDMDILQSELEAFFSSKESQW